jgi:hypothetical protein
VKARANAKPVSGTVFAFGECPDKIPAHEKHKKYMIFYLIKVKLVDPKTKTNFQIIVYRRFSQFELIRDRLLKSRKFESIPALPKKKLFGKTNANNDHLTQRQNDLGVWLGHILLLPNALNDQDFISFLTEEADEKPDGIDVQVNSPITLKGEERHAEMTTATATAAEPIELFSGDDDEGGESDRESGESAPVIRAISGTVYAMGKSPDENHPDRSVAYFVIRVKLEDYDNGLTSQTVVYRRFSQFEQFRARLILGRAKLHETIPPLPKKKLIGKTNKNDNHLFQRQTGLESWLRLVGQLPRIVQDETFQLFLTEGAGDEPDGFQFNFQDPNIVGRLSDDESSDEDSEEESLDDGGSVEVIVHHSASAGAQGQGQGQSPQEQEQKKRADSSSCGGGAVPAELLVPVPPPLPVPPAIPTHTYVYQSLSGYGSGTDTTKRNKTSTCIYYAVRVNSSTVGVKGIHEMTVYRRFSQFEHLRENLMATKKYIVPILPKKKMFGNTSTNTGHMMNRKNELTVWLRTITDTLPNITEEPLYINFISADADTEPANYCAHGTFVIF